jgi:FMN reductase
MRLVVVSGGLRNPSSTRLLADQLAAATMDALAAGDGAAPAEVEVVELRDTAIDVTNNLLTGFPSPKLEEVIEKVATADGLIAVTPVFTTSYNGLFKSFFDILDPQSLNGVPVLIGATAGTPRHSLVLDYSLRPLFTYLHAVVVPTGVFAASSDWGDSGDRVATLQSRVERAAGEFAPLVAASDRSGQVRDPFELDAGFSPTGSYVID